MGETISVPAINSPTHPRFAIWQDYARKRRECRILRRGQQITRCDVHADQLGIKHYHARIAAAELRRKLYASAEVTP